MAEDQYKLLSTHLRELIKQEHSNGTYEHIRRHNSRAGKKNPPANEMAPRFNAFARSPYLLGTGSRNLDIGSNELIIEVKAPLHDCLDYRLGLDANLSQVRMVFGSNIEEHDLVNGALAHNFKMYRASLIGDIQKGDFEHFVQSSMLFINDTIRAYKGACAHRTIGNFTR